ncbi:MAG: PQQ-like beta-propeller repeat protein [Sandaracinaceae bacterium]|jgi:outer membrane protein assembly factor BamB|nr:PQQ-like beta-propeller repeat protein [Sandaracinaceae bacterium]MBK7772590.1 PQQ-like beta-propeller repeat protein [Sandaracinaceae bacterium]MBK8406799.1 PQQ-like beta-propeller repeat protein [Sandaracinaceae bacterium]MBK8587594.1 PQQ-like beta-propeller repeat protein [Sandaracinaceae bacterium]MBP7680621.1 PQQ-like beta-propeller repeat protein [Deltaproteobacteria bacterium]
MSLTLPRPRSVARSSTCLCLAAVSAWMTLAPRVEAQTERYRVLPHAPGESEFRLATANARWIVLERDRDMSHQELLVLRTADGQEVLRTMGMILPADTRRSVSRSWELTMRPYLSGDRLLTFRADVGLVALDLPSGRELWRVALPSHYFLTETLLVTETHVAWADPEGSLRVFDAATGRELYTVPVRHAVGGGRLALGPDGRATVLTWDWEVVTFSAAGVEQSRVALRPDYGVTSVQLSGDLAVVLGSVLHVVDVRAGALIIESEATVRDERLTGGFVGDLLVLASASGMSAVDPRTLTPRWRSHEVGWLSAITNGHLGIAGANGLVTWLDARTGATRQRMSVGEPIHRVRYHGRPSWVAVEGPPASADESARLLVLARDAEAGFIAFDAITRQAPPRTRVTGVVRVNGRPRRGVLVAVGDRTVRTGERGRFVAHVALAGVLRVSVPEEELQRRTGLPCASEVHAVVARGAEAGRPSARTVMAPSIVLDAIVQDFECDAACRCD